jgi:hypothetical protein
MPENSSPFRHPELPSAAVCEQQLRSRQVATPVRQVLGVLISSQNSLSSQVELQGRMIGAMDKDVKFQGNVVRDIVEPNNVELGRIKENLDVLCATGQLQNRKLESIQQVQGRMEQDIGMMRASLDRLDQRQDRTEQDVGVIKERLDRLDQCQDRTEQDVRLIKQDVGLIKERLDRLDQRQDRLDQRQDRTEQDVGLIKQDVGLIKQDVGVIKERLDRLHDLLLQIVSHHNPGASNGDIPQNPQA